MNWEKHFKRIFGVIIIVVLLGFAFEAHSTETSDDGTHTWTSFVVHIREGSVDELTQSTGCPRDSSAACARWKYAPKTAWLDGECWIVVPTWNDKAKYTRAQIMQLWGHEIAHCAKGEWHE
jgi:hypothetical protein